MSHGNRTRTKRKLLQQYYAFGTHARSAFGSAPHLEPHSRLFVILAIFCSEIFLVFSSLKAFLGAAPFSGGEEESFAQKIAKITKTVPSMYRWPSRGTSLEFDLGRIEETTALACQRRAQ